MKKFVLLAAGIAIDFAACNVCVADSYHNRILKITSAKVAGTMAGSVQGYTDGNGGVARFENLSGPSIDTARNNMGDAITMERSRQFIQLIFYCLPSVYSAPR